MAKSKGKKDKLGPATIAVNRKARHEYFIEETFEAGLVLTGWEVKSLRAGKCQIADTYILLKDGEAWLLGSSIQPLNTASTHVIADPTRTRKLLMHRREIDKIIGQTQQKGYTCVPLRMYWKHNRVKCEIALVKGKQLHDKRATEKNRDWQRDKARIMRKAV